MLIAVGLAGSVRPARAAAPKVTARAAILMDARTGEVIWSKSADQRRAPASTTKIVTTMLALESGRLDESFSVSGRAQSQVPSKLHLRTGQKLTLRDLTYALMLKSANDGAVVVAEGLGGSVESFAKTMEERARKAGATRTSFRNPSGLPNAQHLSTARDLAHIVRAALDVPGFRRVAETQSRQIRVRGTKSKTMAVTNKNRLVRGYFASVIGKTGYTRAAGRCFAGAATYEGREVIVVVLGASDLWGDTRKLIEWAHRGDGKTQWPRVQVASAKPASTRPPRSAALAPASTRPPRSAALAPASTRPPRSAALADVPSRPPESAALRPASARPSPQRVAAAGRPTSPPAYAGKYLPEGTVRRGCTGYGCDRGRTAASR